MMQKITKEEKDMITKQFDVSFKVLAEMSPTGIHVTDNTGKCLYVNPSWCRMASLTPEKAFGDGWINAIHKEDRSRLSSEWENFMKEEIPWESEYRFIDTNGKITWVYGTATLLKGSNGSIESILGITIDITGRKNYEIKLKESEERLRLASLATGFGTFSYDFGNGNAYYSREFLQLYDLLPGDTLELDKDLVPKALHPDDKSMFLTEMLKANDPLGSGILDIEFRIVPKDGKERWLRTRGLTRFSGNKTGDRPLTASGIVQDITERKKTEEALIISEKNYRLTYDNAIKEIAKRKQVEKALFHQNSLLAKLNKFSLELSKLSSEDNLEAFIARQLKIISGARVTIFNEYSHSNHTITVRHIEMEPRLLKKVVSLLGSQVKGFASKVSKEVHQEMVSEIIGVRKTLYEASFGSIPKRVAATIQRLINTDRFIGIAYIIDGKIYGTSLLAMDKDRPDPPKEILENFAFLATLSLRRRQAEEVLKEREAEYRGLFENSIMGISQSYPDGGLKRINKAYAEMYGYPDVSTMMKEVSSNVKMLYFHPEDRKKVLEILDKTGYMPPTEFELNRRNGEKFWAIVGAKQVRDNSGKLLYLQAEHREITSRKKLEKEMYSSSLYARSLIEASLDPLVTINAEGKITDVNLATEHVTGFKRERLIGSEFADYFVESDKARDGFNTVFSKGVIKNYPLTIRHKNGQTTDVLYNATLFKNDKGIVQGVFAAARDITLHKRMETKLKNSKKLLEKLNQHLNEVRENERTEIAMNLHDDLGQRLTAFCLDIAWIKSRIGVQSNPVRKKLDLMIREINETIDGIKELSSFLRPTILYDLGLIPAIISQLKKFENQSGIKSYFYFDSEEFNVDEKISLIFYRIIQESLTNIVRHSGASAMELSLKKLKNAIEMVIMDDGIGIDNEKINSLTSMGLEGIRERVRSCHGEVSIKGEEGSGTTIIVTIPIKKRRI